ncbi:MAG TPA: hypothetical protein PL182_08440 [Pseudobdellovibrionaceae bacterium]|nr:hypothetical protein [Pseudobdellovibrionaceae bacterium]
MKGILLLALSLCASPGHAHEGHDKTPGSKSAPHGGIIQGTNDLYLELLPTAEGVEIYPLDHDMNPVPLKNVKMKGTMTFPRKTKKEDVTFSDSGDKFLAKIDAKGAHRYTLDLSVTHDGKTEKLKFNVEPK